MAIIKSLERVDTIIAPQSYTIGDYTISDLFVQLRTYKEGDDLRTEGVKQNIQISREVAVRLRDILDDFLTR